MKKILFSGCLIAALLSVFLIKKKPSWETDVPNKESLIQKSSEQSQQAVPNKKSNIEFHTRDMKHGSFSIINLKNWHVVVDNKNNFILSGPKDKDLRPVLFIANMGLKNIKFNQDMNKKHSKIYFDNKRNYVNSKAGKLLQQFPYKNFKLPGTDNSHSVGVEYSFNNLITKENSIFHNCNGHIWHLKVTTFKNQHLNNTENDLETIKRSFSCKG